MTKKENVKALLNCLMAVQRNLEALMQFVAKESGFKSVASTSANAESVKFNTSANVKSKERKEETKEMSPTPPFQKEKKEKKERENIESCVFAKNASLSRDSFVTPLPLEKRREAFWQDVCRCGEKYGREVCEAFFTYWTEPSKDGTRMRWELQRTWSVASRLATWQRNERPGGKRANKSTPEQKAAAAQREKERIEDERKREAMRAEACPLWLITLGRKYKLLDDGPSTAQLMQRVRQLRDSGQISEEIPE